MSWLIDLLVILILIAGVRLFRTPKGARGGNLLAALAMTLALAVVLVRHPILDPALVVGALLLGSAVGVWVAMKVSMVQIPAMVAFQHGAGGVAAFLVSFLELTRHAETLSTTGRVSGFLGLVIGAATFSGSMVASGKLASLLRQTPMVLPAHNGVLLGNALIIAALSVVAWRADLATLPLFLVVLVLLSVILGIVFAMRIGGADMPVLISFLNATAGLAAAFCGIIIGNRLLIAGGATVAASGSILTHVMLKAMNRSLWNVFVGIKPVGRGAGPHRPVPPGHGAAPPSGWFPGVAAPPEKGVEVGGEEEGAGKEGGGVAGSSPTLPTLGPAPEKESHAEAADPLDEAAKALAEATKVIVIPGFGMAMAQAQFKVVELAERLRSRGKEVRYAIHPLAGRMPGHMHVLLAEAEVPAEELFDIKEINHEFPHADVALVVGACDVVNPAALTQEGTPISGMPILMAHQARRVIVCNLDDQPGYSGVPNPLYEDPKTLLLLGDASETVEALLGRVGELGGEGGPIPGAAGAPSETAPGITPGGDADPFRRAANLLREAESILVIPGFGMAMAQAQFTVVELAEFLRASGKRLRYAIHPLAGRMPGHMHVLLAEAQVPADELFDIKEINHEFPATDVALVVGACDVVNPAALTQEGTPISGMPILMAHQARHVIVCNLDDQPGYSGVPNPLYSDPKAVLLFGDARATMERLLDLVRNSRA